VRVCIFGTIRRIYHSDEKMILVEELMMSERKEANAPAQIEIDKKNEIIILPKERNKKK
jgi:hypothetical protein